MSVPRKFSEDKGVRRSPATLFRSHLGLADERLPVLDLKWLQTAALLYCRLEAGSTLREFSPFVIVRRLRYPMDMNETEQAVLETLLELEDKVAQMRTANPKPNLLPIFERLETLARQLPPGTDPELLHFLHRKSYEKARMLLQGRGGENQKGSCRK